MTKEEAIERVLDYVLGDLSDREREEFDSLVSAHEDLRKEVEQVRMIVEAASTFKRLEVPSEVRQRVLAEARRFSREKLPSGRSFLAFLERLFLSPSFAAALLVLIAVGVGFRLWKGEAWDEEIVRVERFRPLVPEEKATEAKQAPKAESAVQEITPKALSHETGVATPAPAIKEKPRPRKARPTTKPQVPLEVGGVSEELALPAPEKRPQPSRQKARAEALHPERASAPPSQLVPERLLTRARQLRAEGRLEEALVLYKQAVEQADLQQDALDEALIEAAEVAIELKRSKDARMFITRLRAIPGREPKAKSLEKLLHGLE